SPEYSALARCAHSATRKPHRSFGEINQHASRRAEQGVDREWGEQSVGFKNSAANRPQTAAMEIWARNAGHPRPGLAKAGADNCATLGVSRTWFLDSLSSDAAIASARQKHRCPAI